MHLGEGWVHTQTKLSSYIFKFEFSTQMQPFPTDFFFYTFHSPSLLEKHRYYFQDQEE